MYILYRTLEIINYVVIAITTLGFGVQILFILLSWVPKKGYPKAKRNHRFAVIIPAHNESSVIGNTVKNLFDKQTYPRGFYDVFVCADNCTDDTTEIAGKAGATVIYRQDDNPAHRKASYPVKYLMDWILENHPGEYDAFIKLDADNLVCDQFLEKMNDALDSGVDIAKAYEASSNLSQNIWTKVSGTYYVRDSRIPCRVRQFFHMDQILSGAGMMVSTRCIEQIGGWDSMGVSDDSEFSAKRLLEGWRIKYVEEAIVYEDQPSTLKDTFFRLSRMAKGINSVFWRSLTRMIGRFFKTGRLSYLDYPLTMMFVPIAVMCIVWFPAYYIFYSLVNIVQISTAANIGIYPALADPQAYAVSQMYNLLFMIACVVAGYILIYAGQTWLAVFMDRKKLGLSRSLKGARSGILLSPIFMVLYAIAICYGVFAKSKWRSVTRNVPKAVDKTDSSAGTSAESQ